jgi:PAS domain S-box-containing protein
MVTRVKNNFWIPIIVLFLAFSTWVAESNAGIDAAVRFTPQEIQWLEAHPVINAAPDPDYPPVEYFDEKGHYVGIVADYISLISKRLGIQFNIIRLNSWDEVLEKARAREIDMVTAATHTVQREAYLSFTNPIVTMPIVIIARQNETRDLAMENLRGMKIAAVHRYAVNDFINNTYPGMDVFPVSDTQSGLRQVSFGTLDVMVANVATASYSIEKENITNLRIAGESGFVYNLAFAPTKENSELHTILNKGLALIKPIEKKEIYHKWIKLYQDPIYKRKKFWIGLISIASVAMLLVGGVLIWNRSLKRLVEQRTVELKEEVVKHQEALKAVEASEIRYRGVVANTKNGIAVFRAAESGDDFFFLDFNKSGERIDKILKKDLMGKSILEILPGVKAFGLFEVMQRVFATGTPERYPAAHYQDKRTSGWRECFVYKLPSEEIVVVYSDETERKMAEFALRESEEKLAGIIVSVTDLLLILDEDLNIVWSNDIAKHLLGADLVGKSCCSIFARDGEMCEECGVRACFMDGSMHEYEIRIPGRKTEPMVFWVTTSVSSMHENGRPKTVVMNLRDETERKAMAADTMRAAHLASIGELAAGVAHEINNPINGVINLAQILINESLQESLENDVADRIIKEGNRIADIVSSLLAFAHNRGEVKNPVAMADIMVETQALTKAQVRKDGIEMRVDLPPALPLINGHMQQIQQVFLNLINNSRYALNQKYPGTDKNKRIDISGSVKRKNGQDNVRVVFFDTGTGIPEKIIKNVMDPFFTSKSIGVGTGLGLSISHGIITDHGGGLKIESTPGEFTRVIVDLPAGGASDT